MGFLAFETFSERGFRLLRALEGRDFWHQIPLKGSYKESIRVTIRATIRI